MPQVTIQQAFNAALQHHLAGRLPQAQQLCRQILSRQPGHVEALHLLGVIAHQAGRNDIAADLLGQALAGHPGYAQAHDNLGLALRDLGKIDEAIAAHRQAIALKPGFAEAHSHLGIALSAAGKCEEAIAAFRQAIALSPGHAAAHSNLGAALKEQGRYEEAIAACRQAIALRAHYPRALYNLGNALADTGRLDQAIASYLQALALQPDFVEAHFNLGFARLLQGDFPNGWPEFEWRWKSREPPLPPLQQPSWDGGALNGRTILLRAEQGFGDTLQFIRYVPLVVGRGGKVIVECPSPLCSLLRGIPEIDRCVAQGEPLPAFDVHCPLLSLPLLFSTTLESMPAQVPYVFPDAPKVRAWLQRLAEDHAPMKVGLAWAGNPAYKTDPMRSPRQLSLLAPLAQAKNVSFYSLQKGPPHPPGTPAKSPPAPLRLTDWTAELSDFADSAALVAALDLVISSDTAVAHLAGALGKPVWVMLPFAPDWRWLLERTDSPWYPTMRLFRQAKIGDWDEVARRIAAALGELPGPCARRSP